MRFWKRFHFSARTIRAIVCISAVCGMLGWVGMKWRSLFNSDLAMLGLIALHMLKGTDFPANFYGVHYGGTLPSLIAVPFIWLMGSSGAALAVSVLVTLFGFVILEYIWVRRHFGESAATISLIFIALTGMPFISFLVSISTRMALYLLTAICMLHAWDWKPKKKQWQIFRMISIGFLIGLNVWTQPQTLLYIAPFFAVWALASDEWAELRARITKKIRIEHDWQWITLSTLLFLLGAYCNYARKQWIFGVIIAITLLTLFLFSQRKKLIVQSILLLIVGFCIGYLPQIIHGIHTGYFYGSPYAANWPTWEHTRQFFGIALPSLMNLRPLNTWGYFPTYMIVAQAIAIPCLLIVLGSAIVYLRHDLRNIFVLRLKSDRAQSVMLVALFFVLPMLAQLGIGSDESSTRYLSTTWHAWTIVGALGVIALWKRSWTLGLLISGALLVNFGIHMKRFMYPIISQVLYVDEEIEALTDALKREHATTGYADFWLAYVMTYLTNEELKIDYYDENVRYKPTADYIKCQPLNAYIFLPQWHPFPPGSTKKEDFLRVMYKVRPQRGLIPRSIFRDIQSREILKRFSVGRWDVWIMTNPQSSKCK